MAMFGTQPLGLRLHHCWCCAGHFYLAHGSKMLGIVQTLHAVSGVRRDAAPAMLRRVGATGCRVVSGRGESAT